MQRKLIGLGLGSLGTITGVNFILRGEADNLPVQSIENKEEALDFTPELEVQVSEKSTPKPPQVPKVKKPKTIEDLKSIASKLKYTNSNHDHRGVKIGYLKGFLITKDPARTDSIVWGNGVWLEYLLKQLPNKQNSPIFKDNGLVDWDKLKAEAENGSYPFIG